MDTDFDLPLDLEDDAGPPPPPPRATPAGADARTALPLATQRSDPQPRLGVYVLTEFVFCPRAGLCAYELAREEAESSLPAAGKRARYYTLQDIEAALVREFWNFWLLV